MKRVLLAGVLMLATATSAQAASAPSVRQAKAAIERTWTHKHLYFEQCWIKGEDRYCRYHTFSNVTVSEGTYAFTSRDKIEWVDRVGPRLKTTSVSATLTVGT